METIFTAEQISKFEKEMEDHAPPFPVSEDGMHNPQVVSLTTVGGPAGLLLNLQADTGIVKLFFNPVVTRQLAINILHANETSKSWDKDGQITTKPSPKAQDFGHG